MIIFAHNNDDVSQNLTVDCFNVDTRVDDNEDKWIQNLNNELGMGMFELNL